MKTIIIAGKEFNELKPDSFYYCGRKYISERYISKDSTILITSDNGFNYTRILVGNDKGKATDKTAELLNRDIHSYPVYGITDKALSVINNVSANIINVHPSHFK